MLNSLELNGDFQYALDLLEKTRTNMFITGRAGTGKSTLLHLFCATTRKQVAIVAPTGIAALNVGGQTIHSFFGFPGRFFHREDIKKRRDKRLYTRMEILVIDEISMVRADMLDHIDYFLRINRDNPLPFGGVQVVFFGDMFQLPPVVSSQEEIQYFQTHYTSPYFFSAQVFDAIYGNFKLEHLELRQVYRQSARRFIRLLDAVRLNQIDFDDLAELNERHDPEFKETDYYITLTTRNDIADKINERNLNQIAAKELTYLAEVKGEFDQKQYPCEHEMRLRVGSQIMFIKNDPKREYVNGTIGKIVSLEADKIKIEIEERNGSQRILEVEKSVWNILRYKASEQDTTKIDAETVGTFKQYPLRLAWAMTIHKSQGKTFDRVIIDLGSGAFEHGQTYVALSRCRTLDGIVLRQPLKPRDIRTDETVIDFYERNF